MDGVWGLVEENLHKQMKGNNMSNIEKLNETFSGYKIKAVCTNYEETNNYGLFSITMNPGCKLSKLESISEEIQICLGLHSLPTFIPYPDLGIVKMIVAIKSDSITLDSLLENQDLKGLDVVFGVDHTGKTLIVNLQDLPHMIVAGTTGSGKSCWLHNIILNFVKTNRKNVDLLLFDPKLVEFKTKYPNYPGFLSVDYTYEDTIRRFKFVRSIMEKRFAELAKFGARNIDDYNNMASKKMNYVVCIVDEIADLMLKDKKTKEFETLICEIAAKSRASGIHLILATQRPSVNVISGTIKANFQSRVSFKVSSAIDSRVVLDKNGAENLLSRGDAIFVGSNILTRFKSPFVVI